jgi:hypothetical protein
MGAGDDEACWLCGSATSDLYRQRVSRPAQVRGRDQNFGVWGRAPREAALSRTVGALMGQSDARICHCASP